MRFSISWIAFKGLHKAELLGRSGLRDTGVAVATPEGPFCLAELPTGWAVLFVNSFGYASPERVAQLSKAATAVACQVEDQAMVSAAAGYVDARKAWGVRHDARQSIYSLATEGLPPPELEPIRQELTATQDRSGGHNAGVNYIFDVPIDLAAALTGYRHDRLAFDWGRPPYVRLEARA